MRSYRAASFVDIPKARAMFASISRAVKTLRSLLTEGSSRLLRTALTFVYNNYFYWCNDSHKYFEPYRQTEVEARVQGNKVTDLPLLIPLKPIPFYWNFIFNRHFIYKHNRYTNKFFIQTCFKPLIVPFNGIIDIVFCKNRVIQVFSRKLSINCISLLYLSITINLSICISYFLNFIKRC